MKLDSPIPRPSPSSPAFTLVEILFVIAVMSILVSIAAMSLTGGKSTGNWQGTINQLSQAVEEARMTAIETNTKTYLGFANANHPDGEKKLRSYILFREYTQEEKSKMTPAPAANRYLPLTAWETLPSGFEYSDASGSLLEPNSAAKLELTGLPGDPASVHAVAFGPLGQVDFPASTAPALVVKPVGHADASAGFVIHINRLTGRVRSESAPISTP